MITVVLVDDDHLVRAGIRLLLEATADIDVVGEAAGGLEAIDLVTRLEPDVALMDVQMSGGDGITATESITRLPEATRVIVLTTFEHEENIVSALRAGASGFLSKRVAPSELVDGIRRVAGGDALLSPTATRQLIERVVRPAPSESGLSQLTARERDVLVAVASGLSNDEIAESLVIAANTVKTHVKRVLRKLGARDRAQAVVVAYRCGLMSEDPHR